jgi:SAM-dependent methyltransferase
MQKDNSNFLWNSLDELGITIQKSYSVTGKETIRKQYLEQVKQYPLYLKWFEMIEEVINKQKSNLKVLEYGSGPGILAKMLVKNSKVKDYHSIEPEKIFREMTLEETNNKARVTDSKGEDYLEPESYDAIIATATYHHFYDKIKALQNAHKNLKQGGIIIIADGFIPEYEFDKDYKPKNKQEFIERVLEYTSAQIISMPNPKTEEVVDQIKTAFLDTLRIEELKVCFSILKKQLDKIGFKNVRYELMRGDNKNVNYNHLGYYFVVAHKQVVVGQNRVKKGDP